MDRRVSCSMPLLYTPMGYSPLGYRDTSPFWAQRRSSPRGRPRQFYVGGVRTKLIGADSYPNPSGSPRRMVLCGSSGSYEKTTRSSSTAELSRTGVYCSREDLRYRKAKPRAVSCEDVFRATSTTGLDCSRLSESGVSMNDSYSRTDLGSSFVGLEDVDGVSQCSFGSSSAFHEITCDSEMDRPDSDCLSVPGSGYGHHDRHFSSHDGDSRGRRRDRGGGGHGKARHDSGSREKFLADLTVSSGRSSPREEDKEFFHSTPTKRGSPVLSIFPADEDDIHFPSLLPKDAFHEHSSVDSLLDPTNDSLLQDGVDTSSESLPASPTSANKKKAKKQATESISSSKDAVKEALKRRRQQFFTSLQDCSKLEEPQSAGESVQSWLTTVDPQRHAPTSPLPDSCDPPPQQQQQQQQQGQTLSAPSSREGTSVRDRVRAIEQGLDFQINAPDQTPTPTPTTHKGSELLQTSPRHGSGSSSNDEEEEEEGERRSSGDAVSTSSQPAPPVANTGGGAERVSPQHLYPPSSSSSALKTASLLNNPRNSLSAQAGDDDVSDAERRELRLTDDGFNELSFPGNSTSLFSSSSSTSFGDSGDEKQAERGGVSGYVSGLSEADGACLGVINSGPADQLTGGNYCAVSGNDGYAITGANSATAGTTQPLLTAHNAAEPTAVGRTPDVYHREDRQSGGIREEGGGGRSLTTEKCAITSDGVEVASGASQENDGDKKVVGDSEKNHDARSTAQDRRFESLVSGFSDTDDVRNDSADDNESGHTLGKGDESVLYHARPIQIVSPVGGGDDSALHTPHDSPPSSLLRDDEPLPNDTPRDDADAEVQAVLGGVTTRPPSSDWQQDVKTAAADMEYQFQPPVTDLASDEHAALGVMTVREVSQHRTRHVHHKRTTVQETVTTRHTLVRQSTAGSPTSALGEGEEEEGGTLPRWSGPGENKDFEMTDKTVSRVTVIERDNDKEELTTRKTTQLPMSMHDAEKGACEHSLTTLHKTPEQRETMSGVEHRNQQRESRGYTESAQAMLRDRPNLDDSYHVLDSLQEQLSVLSSEVPSVVSSTHDPQPSFGYTDHAEASLPPAEQTELNTSTNSGIIRGTGSVFITLDRNGSQELPESDVLTPDTHQAGATDWATDRVPHHGTLASESEHDGPVYRARAIQILPNGERVLEMGEDDPAASSHPSTSSWGLPGSSSEINDSDDRCTPISISGSHAPHLYSDSDSCAEGDAAVHTFQDFLSGLQGQVTSDLPSLHRSVDVMVDDFPPHLLRPSFIQETILEADDEGGCTTEEDMASSPTIDSFKTSLHFTMPEASPPNILSVSSVSHTRQQSAEDRAHTLPPEHTLENNFSDKLSTISGPASHDHRVIHDSVRDGPDPYLFSQHAHRSSPPPSDIKEGSVYSTSASADVLKATELSTANKPVPTYSLTSGRPSASYKEPKNSQWVQEKIVLFKKLLNDFESQSKTSERKLMEEMVAMDTGRGRGDDSALEKQSEFCDDLYRMFTREHLEMRQSHVCPVIEDHLPAFRFRRFLRKKHNSKLKGNRTVRVCHQLERLEETSQRTMDSDVWSTSDVVVLTKTRQPPYHIHNPHRILSPSSKLRGRYVSDVFTDDADVNRSMSSDSAYSSLSGTLSSRNVSDLDSTFRSVTGSRADVSSIATDVSLDEDKLRSLSEVFDTEMFEGDVDQARLDRLQVGHHKAETL